MNIKLIIFRAVILKKKNKKKHLLVMVTHSQKPLKEKEYVLVYTFRGIRIYSGGEVWQQ